jgi:peroxiredoxin
LFALTVAVVVLAVVLLGACWAIYQLMVQQGRHALQFQALERRLREQGIATGSEAEASRGLRPGSLLNNFELPSLSGSVKTLFEHRGHKLLLIFFNPACSYSRAMMPELARLQSIADRAAPKLMIISTGDKEENHRLFAEYQISYTVLLQERLEVAELYLVTGTPMGYLLDEKLATVGNLLVGGQTLLKAARGNSPASDTEAPVFTESKGRAYSPSHTVQGSRLRRDGLEAGTVAPLFSLPQLDESSLSLESFRGHKVLLVFSDPACGPCNELAPKLEQIHRRRDDLRVLMISRGDPEANRRKVAEHGITFPVVLQRHWEISRAYGMFATPIAYLIDEAGILISDVMVGSDAIRRAAAGKLARAKSRSKELVWQ